MQKNAIIASLVIAVLLGFALWFMIFREPEPEPESEIEVTGPTPGPSPEEEIVPDEEEIVPDEEETSLDNAPTEGEVEEETTGEVSPYMIKK
jgi:cytoskeletal protein RodZ